MGWYDSFKTGTLDHLANGWGKGKDKKKKSASSFWADEWSRYEYNEPTYWNGNAFVSKSLSKVETSTVELLKLNAHKRAISNFVNILTNKNIPVKFSTKGDSYTDGKMVVLSAEAKPEKFDIAVGLALHEASHIMLTDFTLFPIYVVPTNLLTKYLQTIGLDFNADAVQLGLAKDTLFDVIKSLTNFVEDRRIDQYIYDTCPGYRDYYRALYEEYFYDKTIDKGLKSDEYTDETIESYMFRIINITNANSNLGKLKGLRKIYQLLDLKNIKRLKSTKDSLNVSEQIVDILLDNIILDLQQKQSGGKGEGENGQPTNDPAADVNEVGDEQNDQMGGANGEAPVMGEQSNDDKDMMSKNGKQLLDKTIKKQKDFVNNNIKKKSLTKKDNTTLEQIAESGTDMESVGNTHTEEGHYIKGTQCIVSKKMTEKLMEDSSFPFATKYSGKWSGWNEKALQQGILLGTLLGKRLQIRSEERETISPRQKNGRIDKRLVAALGFDYDSVFSTKEIDKFKKVMLHISIDGSGSMSGTPWDNTLKLTIAMCKAATMVNNLEVQVSIRGTWDTKAYVCIAYDSRLDKFTKVKQLFPALHANGTTPEGLCYEAIMKHFVEATKDMESYFVNICDGEPSFSDNNCSYGGRAALLHTRKMVRQIKEKGIKVLAYFASDRSYSSSRSVDNFKVMYGSDSKFVDIESIVPISKTLNELFLKK